MAAGRSRSKAKAVISRHTYVSKAVVSADALNDKSLDWVNSHFVPDSMLDLRNNARARGWVVVAIESVKVSVEEIPAEMFAMGAGAGADIQSKVRPVKNKGKLRRMKRASRPGKTKRKQDELPAACQVIAHFVVVLDIPSTDPISPAIIHSSNRA